MRRMNPLWVGFLILALAIPSVRPAGLTTGADFLLVNTGARPDAMGGAFSAVADDVNTFSYNPAGLANIRLPELGYSHYLFVSDIYMDFVGLAAPVGKIGVLGAGYIGLGVTPFNSTDNPSAQLGTASEKALLFGWGKSFGKVHVGLTAKYVNRQIGTVSGSGFLGDVGGRYRINPRLTVAASFLNMGPPIQMIQKERPPTITKWGVAWRMWEARPHTLDVTMDAQYSFESRRPLYGWGAEYWYLERYALRAGWVGNSEDEGLTAGVGIKVSFLQIDYAYQPFNLLGSTHRFSGVLRWDGPWVKGGEPNPPKYVTARNLEKALEVRWEKPTGPVAEYEVMVRALDGSQTKTYSHVAGPPYLLPDTESGTIYSISLKSVAPGGGKSFPTTPIYVERVIHRVKLSYREGTPSVSNGVNGILDPVGLKLTWTPPADIPAAGYHLYLKKPSGEVRRLTSETRRDTTLWLPETQGMEGCEFQVAVVNTVDGTEKIIGNYQWYPSRLDLRDLSRPHEIRLKATAQGNGKTFLDWDHDPGAASYSLLYSIGQDGVFQLFGDFKRNKSWALLSLTRPEKEYHFIVVSRDEAGKWIQRSRVDSNDNTDLRSAPPDNPDAP